MRPFRQWFELQTPNDFERLGKILPRKLDWKSRGVCWITDTVLVPRTLLADVDCWWVWDVTADCVAQSGLSLVLVWYIGLCCSMYIDVDIAEWHWTWLSKSDCGWDWPVQRTVLASMHYSWDCSGQCGLLLGLDWYKARCFLLLMVFQSGLGHRITMGNVHFQSDFDSMRGEQI